MRVCLMYLFMGIESVILCWIVLVLKAVRLENVATLALRRACQYSQALACQPLRRHMSSFVKHYRPMNMAERQRRHDIKDLEAQVRLSQRGICFLFFSLGSHVVHMVRDCADKGEADLTKHR